MTPADMKLPGFGQDFAPVFRFAEFRRLLESRRRVDPQHPGLAAARVFPAMRRGALKIETVARLELVLLFVQGNLQFSLEDIQKFLAFMMVRLTAAGVGSDAKQVR